MDDTRSQEPRVRIRCGTCGRPLLGDPDDDPHHPVAPVCGDCARERDFDEIDLSGRRW